MAGSKSSSSIIYLIGMPGSGKTTLGKQLAKSKSMNFIDLDAFIEQKINKNSCVCEKRSNYGNNQL